jgi:hypothetical protein
MARQKEGRLQYRIRKKLEKEVGGWWKKVHGGPFQDPGIGDLIGCVDGQFFNLEVKRPKKGKTSDIQIENLREVARNGGGAEVVESAKQAIAFVKAVLRAKGPSEVGRRVLFGSNIRSIAFSAEIRKNLDRARGNRSTEAKPKSRHRAADKQGKHLGKADKGKASRRTVADIPKQSKAR